MRKIGAILFFVLFSVCLNAQPVNSYSFNNTTGSYSSLASETVLWEGTFDNAVTIIAIPLFKISDTGYTSLTVSSNGFVTFGSTAPSTTLYTPISGSTAYDAAVSGMGVRLCNAASGTPKVSYNTDVGGEIVVQWQDVRRYSVATDVLLNFQIRLNPSTNEIKIVYGSCSTTYTSTSYSVQVGLRGNNYDLYNNRTTTTDWGATTAGTSRSATCRLNNTVFPAEGLTFTWTPPAECVAPVLQPTSLILSPYSTSRTDGTFTAATGSDSYLVVRTTDETLSENPVDGTTYSTGDALGNGIVVQSDVSTSFSASGLTNGVEYFFHVFSMNSQCSGGPLYLTASPLTGSAYTIPNTPTSITATAVSSSEITLAPVSTNNVLIAWNTVNSFGTPSVAYNAGNEMSGGGTVFYVGDPALVPTHSGLNNGTTYYYRCWAVAGTTYSTSYREANATTVTDLPYFEGFEASVSSGVNITGWQQDGTGAYWKVYNTGAEPRTGSWHAAIAGTADRWMYRSFNLVGGQLYYIKLYALGTFSSSEEMTITVSYGTTATSSDMTNNIVPATQLDNVSYKLIEGFFMPPSNGIYYIGINGYVTYFSNIANIDDINIEEADECPPPTMVTATNINSSGADITWNQFGGASQWNLKYGFPGFDPETEGTAINNILTLTQTITGLNPLTQYEVFMQAVCDGTPGGWSEPCVFTTIVDPMSGTYTIDQGQPASSTNFTSFNHFKSFLEAGGLGGAVVVNVVAESGPYNEQIIFNEVSGVSETNTITINGNGNTLEYLSTNSDQRATLKLNGAKYMVFNNLTIKELGEETGEYGYAVQLMNNADDNSFIGCQIIANETSSSSNFSALVASNSNTNTTSSGETATNLIVDQCTISGGYYAVSLNGPTDAGIDLNLVFTNNTIKDFYSRGLNLSYQRNAMISGNHFCFTGMRTVSSLVMIYLTQNSNDTKITGNRINNFAGSNTTDQTITVYGIYGTSLSAAIDRKLLIANNLIYGFDKISGSQYGIYLSGINMQVFHNTISLDFVDYPGLGQQYGIYHTGSSANLEMVNNLISIESNGSNTKYALLYATSGAIQNSNNNVIYMNTPNGSSNYTGRYVSTNYPTLVDWQTTGFDANSVAADPYFSSETPLLPQNVAIDNIGANLLSVVPVDFEGTARAETPDPGAYEFMAECMPPVSLNSAQVYNTAGTSVRLGWTAQNSESDWDVEYGLSGFTLGEGTTVGTNQNPFIITGLTPNTGYDFYVSAVCSEGFESEWAGPEYFELCPDFDVPLTCDFEDLEASALPDCWSKWPVESSQVGVTASSGYNSLQSMWVSGSSEKVFLISPEMQAPLNSLYVNFWAKYSSSTGNLEIGTVNSPDDTASFTLVRSIPLTTGYKYYQILFDDNEGAHKYIVISSPHVRAFIDNLTIDLIPSCVKPVDLGDNGITSSTASLVWDAGNDEPNWELAYGAPGFDPDTEGTRVGNINETAYTITGLLPGSRVEAYVRSDCGSGSYSDWSLSYYFETPCGNRDLPYEENFSDPSEPLCWTDELNYWELSSNTNNAGGTTPYEAFYQQRILSGISRLVTPVINTAGKQEIVLNFKSQMVDYTLGNYQATIKIQTQRESATWWITENWEMDVRTGSNDPMDVSISIPTIGTDYLKIAFCISGDHMALSNWAIDDVSVTEVTSCFTPISLNANNSTANTVDLWWTQPGSENSWDIEYGPVGFVHGEGTLIEDIGLNTYTLSGLESSSTYEVYVRANCSGSEHSFWSEPAEFRTICDQVYDLPFIEEFDETEMAICWQEQLSDPLQSGDFDNWIVEKYNDAGGAPNQLALYYSSYIGVSRLILPQLNTTGISTVDFSFETFIDNYKTSPLDFKVQMSTDGENWDDIPGWGHNTEDGIFGPQNVSVEINGLASDVLFLAFVVDGDHENFYFWSVDNVEVVSNSVPENLEVTSFDASCFNALNDITVAGNSSVVLIPDGENAAFIAGHSIRFLPGFHAESGSYVHASITTTGTFCDGLTPSSVVYMQPVEQKSEMVELSVEDFSSHITNEKMIKVYPNPNNGRFTLETLNFEEKFDLSVYNMTGMLVYKKKRILPGLTGIEIPYLEPGIYQIMVTDGAIVRSVKMIVR